MPYNKEPDVPSAFVNVLDTFTLSILVNGTQAENV